MNKTHFLNHICQFQSSILVFTYTNDDSKICINGDSKNCAFIVGSGDSKNCAFIVGSCEHKGREYENGDVNGRETDTSFLVAVFRFWRQNITMLWRESENDTCKQI